MIMFNKCHECMKSKYVHVSSLMLDRIVTKYLLPDYMQSILRKAFSLKWYLHGRVTRVTTIVSHTLLTNWTFRRLNGPIRYPNSHVNFTCLIYLASHTYDLFEIDNTIKQTWARAVFPTGAEGGPWVQPRPGVSRGCLQAAYRPCFTFKKLM